MLKITVRYHDPQKMINVSVLQKWNGALTSDESDHCMRERNADLGGKNHL